MWHEGSTAVAQAHNILGRTKNVAGFLAVDAIRMLRPDLDDPAVKNLEVEWETALAQLPDGGIARSLAPGAEGHCGLRGLDQGGNGKQDSQKRKSLRAQLARLANRRVVNIERSADS